MIYLGDTKLNRLPLGNLNPRAAYIGDVQVYGEEQTTTTSTVTPSPE